MSYLQAIVIALVQGITELFPVSSLGHSVLVPAWIGGSWKTLVTQSAQPDSSSSFYLAFIVALHVGTALALLWYFRVDWVRIIASLLRSARRSLNERAPSIHGTDERLAWLIVLATIPVGIVGLGLEHVFRTLFAKPVAAGAFLFANGLILLWAERARRSGERRERRAARRPAARAEVPMMPIGGGSPDIDAGGTLPGGERFSRDARAKEIRAAWVSDARIGALRWRDGLLIGLLQVLALLAGISRDGITMAGGLWRGLRREDAARFAFLLATPPILAAGLLKIPSLTGHAAAHIHGQVAVGFLVTGVTAYLATRYLVRYFRRGRTLTPFAVYCLLAGGVSAIRFAIG